MNFTREPIIETIITPKEGCKLAVRNSKGVGNEEYFVDALEVVSFGGAYFYRSIERSKSFLLSVTDFEVVELKESRINLKHVSIDKPVKIGGGRDATMRVGKDEDVNVGEKKESSQDEEPKQDKKKEGSRRRTKRRRSNRPGVKDKEPNSSEEVQEEANPEQKQPKQEENSEKNALRSLLLVPPDSLISESLGIKKRQLEMEELSHQKHDASDESSSPKEASDDKKTDAKTDKAEVIELHPEASTDED